MSDFKSLAEELRWFAEEVAEGEWSLGTEPGVDDIGYLHVSGSKVERSAHAHLAAAAPDLLVALRDLLAEVTRHGEWSPAVERSRTALARAIPKEKGS